MSGSRHFPPANNLHNAFVGVARSRCLSLWTVVPVNSGRVPQYWVCRLHLFTLQFSGHLQDNALWWCSNTESFWKLPDSEQSREPAEAQGKSISKSHTPFFRRRGIAEWTKWREPGRRTWGQCFEAYNTAKFSFRRWITAWFVTTNSGPTLTFATLSKLTTRTYNHFYYNMNTSCCTNGKMDFAS